MAIGQIQFRRDTEANLKLATATLLAAGEVGFAIDKNYFAIGDGSTAFALLPIYEPSPVLYDKISGIPSLEGYADKLLFESHLYSYGITQTYQDNLNVIFGNGIQGLTSNLANGHDNFSNFIGADLTDSYPLIDAINAADAAISARLTVQEVRVYFSGSYTDLTNKPELFNGDYATMTNKPVLFNGAYASLTGLPTLFNGDYATLTNKPVLFNGAYASLTGLPTLFNGDYATLTNKPVIPVLPSVNNQTTFTAQATVPLVAQIAVGTAKLFKVGTAAPKWYANDAGVIRAV